jgi:hypothetical protein
MSDAQFDDLANQLEQSLTEFNSDHSEQPPSELDADSSREELRERVRASLMQFADVFESADSFEEVTHAAENLWTILDEAEDVRDSFDAEAFFKTVDTSKLPDAIELSEVPEAVESGKPRKAINLKGLMEAVDFREFWSSDEMQEIWRESKELSDALGGDSDEEGDEEFAETAKEKTEMASEVTEGKLQSELADNTEEFREKIAEARDRLKEQIEQSELGSGGEGESATRNITAVSTMPETRPDMEVHTGFSTMQSDRPDMDVTVHYSTMPKGRQE